jgi:hypothetical protein
MGARNACSRRGGGGRLGMWAPHDSQLVHDSGGTCATSMQHRWCERFHSSNSE